MGGCGALTGRLPPFRCSAGVKSAKETDLRKRLFVDDFFKIERIWEVGAELFVGAVCRRCGWAVTERGKEAAGRGFVVPNVLDAGGRALGVAVCPPGCVPPFGTFPAGAGPIWLVEEAEVLTAGSGRRLLGGEIVVVAAAETGEGRGRSREVEVAWSLFTISIGS